LGWDITVGGYQYVYDVTFGAHPGDSTLFEKSPGLFAAIWALDADLQGHVIAGFDPSLNDCCSAADHFAVADGPLTVISQGYDAGSYSYNYVPADFEWFCAPCEFTSTASAMPFMAAFSGDWQWADFTFVSTTAPEPPTAALMLSAAALLGLCVRTKWRADLHG